MTADTPRADLYSMQVVTRLTGLTADTIRVWERRYQVVAPTRTGGNTRRYSADEVRRLTLLREATDLGHRIGDIAYLPEAELARLIDQDNIAALTRAGGEMGRAPDPYNRIRADYLTAIQRFDVRVAGELLARTASLVSSSDFIYKVVLPILKEAGDCWEKGIFSVAQEHLISAQVRCLLDSLMRLYMPAKGGRRMLVTTPEGERHEFGALVGALLAASKGFETIYLGPEVPEADLLSAIAVSRADILLLGVLRDRDASEELQLRRLLQQVSADVETWVGMPAESRSAGDVSTVRYLHRFEDMEMALMDRLVTAGRA
jgi:DNA-binding transcriptional MerR regulator/methylmalonyl-CoA mutase cobalamin-binding subunit